MTTKRRTKSILILLAVFLISIVCAVGGKLSAKKVDVFADYVEDSAVVEAIQTTDMRITDGVHISNETVRTLYWEIHLSNDSIRNLFDKVSDGYLNLINSYNYNEEYWMQADLTFYLFRESELGSLNAVEIRQRFTYVYERAEHGVFLDPEFHVKKDLGVKIGDRLVTPFFSKEFSLFRKNQEDPLEIVTGNINEKIRVYFEPKDIDEKFVPVLLLDTVYHRASFWGKDYDHSSKHVLVNTNAIRGVRQVSASAYEKNAWIWNDELGNVLEEDLVFKNILLANMGEQVAIQELENSLFIEDLQTNHPLDLTMFAGAEFSEEKLMWKCKIRTVGYDEWKKVIEKLSVNWMILEFEDFDNTGSPYEDFKRNFSNAQLIVPESTLTVDGENYISTVTFAPEDDATYYIAIPYIKAIGVKPQVVNRYHIAFEDVASGTYILCDENDNARSKASFLGDEDGNFVYNFHYLKSYSDKPFAKAEVKTLSRTERIDFNNVGMADFAEICGLELNKEGNVECLLSIIDYWFIEQSSTHTYNIRASYSVLPLTFQDDQGLYEVKYVGLVPFSSLSHVGLEDAPVTMLKNTKGDPYFTTLWEVKPYELYGYFYAYSYATNQTVPNWQVNPDMYDGVIVYFTRKVAQMYQIGYGEALKDVALSGLLGLGKKVSTVANANAEALENLLIATGGDVCGDWVENAHTGFSNKWNSETITYNIEYGFLDGTSLTPGIFYKTEAEGEISQWEQILLIIIIGAEVIALCWFLSKIKKLHPVFVVIAMLAFVGLFIWLDILAWNFFLVG